MAINPIFMHITGTMYLRLPKTVRNTTKKSSKLACTNGQTDVPRIYLSRHRSKFLLKTLLIFAGSIGGIETIAILLVWCFVIRTHKNHEGSGVEAYQIASTGFRRYAYSELKKATRNFQEEIGKGATGTVYRAVLPCGRTAAVKRLREASQGEDEFLAEVGTIGKLNHMNLIEMWGYCVEGKHRLLVYEYMTRGSLDENLTLGKLDWTTRFNIAVGAARGLAYLHEECLEWVLHCDVKPQNILLDGNYLPKVADLGLSKLMSRRDQTTSTFSKIRGTRGYVAPEWVYNLPITSKVDVYSYGIVLLEMVTGLSPSENVSEVAGGGGGKENRRLTTWVKEKVKRAVPMETWIHEPISDDSDVKRIENLIAVALQCVAEDRDVRPSMSQVVEMLQRFEN